MAYTRRDFLAQSSLAAASLIVVPRGTNGAQRGGAQQRDVAAMQLCMFALDAARSAGATYADARIVRRRLQTVSVREERVGAVQDDETVGIGVRVLAGAAWGFAASERLTRSECVRLAQAAVEQARATTADVVLAPVLAYPDGVWKSPVDIDPFDVAVEDKRDLLLAASAEALRVERVRSVTAAIECVRSETTFASTAGSVIVQTAYRTYPWITVTAVGVDGSSQQTRSSTEVPPMGLGFEHVEAADLPGRAGAWAEEAAALLSAKTAEPGTYDLVLAPSNLVLPIHETLGRATELDRALGSGSPEAGTSYLTPPEQMLGRFRFGPEFMNVQADRTQRGALATVGWDDEGVAAESWSIVKDGVLADYQTTRELAPRIADLTGNPHSHGCARADSWERAPMQRMPNVSLLPGADDYLLDDLIAATDRGILVQGTGPHSVDREGFRFRIGGEVCYEIRDGKLGAMLRDVAYEATAPELWNSLEQLGGPRSYELVGKTDDVKGSPPQSNAMSHGCPPALFRGVQVVTAAG
jgi:TldD protein